MRLTLDALLVIDAIDRKGSFAAAAHELHRVPSAVTYSVQKLEEDLDVLLFVLVSFSLFSLPDSSKQYIILLSRKRVTVRPFLYKKKQEKRLFDINIYLHSFFL